MGIPDRVTASYEQERAFVLDRVYTDRAALNTSRAVLVIGGPRIQAVETALRRLALRHEALRTALTSWSGVVTAIVADVVDIDFTVEDCSGADDPLRHARESAEAFAVRPFDLDVAPLWRVLLLTVDADRQVLVLSMHAAVADDATLSLVLRELFDLCDRSESIEALEDSGVGIPVRPYREYAARQRDTDPRELARQEASWREALGEAAQPAGLPVFRQRPAAQTFAAARHRSDVPLALAERTERCATGLGLDVRTLLTAAFAALLYRYGARSEATFGHFLTTRDPGETVLGPCGGPAALRLRLDAAMGFEDLCRRAADGLAHAAENRDLPFQKVVRAVGVEPDAAMTPLFQLVFDVEPDSADFSVQDGLHGFGVEEFDVAPVLVD